MTNLNIYLQTLTPNTARSYGKNISHFFEVVNKDETTVEDIDVTIYTNSIKHLSSSTQNQKICSVKGYFEFLVNNKIIATAPSFKIKRVAVVNEIADIIEIEDVKAMLNVTKNKREYAMMYTLANIGMRVSELISLKISDLIPTENGAKAVITQKGGSNRTIYFSPKHLEIVNDYLKVRKEMKDGSDILFVSNGGNKMSDRKLNDTWKKLASKAGIGKNVTNHSFRHLVVSVKVDEFGIDKASHFIGHKNIVTTMRYNHIKEKTNQDMAMSSVI